MAECRCRAWPLYTLDYRQLPSASSVREHGGWGEGSSSYTHCNVLGLTIMSCTKHLMTVNLDANLFGVSLFWPNKLASIDVVIQIQVSVLFLFCIHSHILWSNDVPWPLTEMPFTMHSSEDRQSSCLDLNAPKLNFQS